MPRLKLFLLGAPQLELAGVSVDLHSHKALALFAYLAVTQQPHSRAKLATLFWPDQGESRALAYLRHTLWTIRKTLGEEWLEGEQEWVGLKPGCDLWVDVTHFAQQLDAANPQLEAALQLYRDDFLAGFSLRDSPAFDEWHFFQSEHLRQQLAAALQQLVDGCVSKGDVHAAIPYARRWLALDPLHEPAHQRLLQLYAWCGQRAAAVRQYRECRRILRDELDVNPSPQTQALYQQLQNNQLQPPQSPAAHSQQQPTPTSIAESTSSPTQDQATTNNATTNGETNHRDAPNLFADELRFVTLLCIGLSGSATPHDPLTDLPAPDLLAQQASDLLGLVRDEASPYQVSVEPVMGGAIQLLFGATATHEDDAERALQVALAILQRAHHHLLPISIGVCSGLVYLGTPRTDQIASGTSHSGAIVLGSVVTLATRIQSRLATGECGVSKPVYRQTQGTFRFQSRSLHLSEIDAPLLIYQLLGRQHAPRKVRGIPGLHAQLVGRNEELRQLQRLAGEVEQGNGQLAAIIGEAGVGKSRLAMEFHAHLPRRSPPWLWLEGRCLEMAQGTGYAPFMDLLRTFWGWRPEETDASRANSIRLFLADLHEDGSLQSEEMSEIGALLGRLLGLRFESEWDRRLDHVAVPQIHARTASALCRLFVAISQHQPLLLVIEDLHWADTLSLDLVHLLLEVLPQNALFLLCIYRPEQQRRSWQLATSAARKCPGHFSQITLHELTPVQSRLMIANLLHLPGHDDADLQAIMLPAAVQELILMRAQGNPLYLEELIYSLIDRGVLLRQSNGWKVAAEIKLSSVPESLQSIIFTRLDALGSPWKQVLQRAAVIGRTVRRRLLAELMPPDIDLDDALQHLIDAMFLYQERLFPEPEYSFRHVLVQDAIYHGLTQRQRRQLHRQVAQRVEALAGERLHEQIDLLAHHWSQAGEPKEAIHYLLLAGDKAYASLAYREAAEYYRHAVGFLRQQEDQSLTARTLMKLGNSYHSTSEFRSARQAFDDCFALQQQIEPASSASQATPTAILRLAWTEPYILNPTVADNTSMSGLADQFFSGLVDLGPNFEVLPAVAQRWEILAGGRRYLFHLRQNVLWEDGTSVTAHDFVAAWKSALAPGSAPSLVTFFTLIKHAHAFHAGTLADCEQLGIHALDVFTLEIELEQPGHYFLQMLASAAAKPIPSHLVEKCGQNWSDTEHFIGNGAFRLVAWQAKQAMVLERNPAFLGASAGNVGRVELFFHQSIAQQLARYEADELDVLWLNDFSGEELARLRQNHPGEYLSSPLLNVIFAVFDASRPPFDDMRVRQAFVHAVDRDALVNGTLGGSANPAQGGYVPYGMPGHSPTIGLRFDPARADELLNKAGYGDRTTFPALRLMAWHGIAPVCDALSAAWRGNLEVQTEWELLDYYKFLRSWNPTRPSIFLFGMSCEFPDAGLMLDNLFSISFTSWKNLEFLQLFEAAQKNADPVQRLLQIGQADALAMAEAAVMPLYYERMQMLIKPRIRHYPLSPTNWWFWKDVVMES